MIKYKIFAFLFLTQLLFLFGMNTDNSDRNKKSIFPLPLKVEKIRGQFVIDSSAFILLFRGDNPQVRFVSQLLYIEIADKYELPLKLVEKSRIDYKEKFFLIGTIKNPLVKKYCESNNLQSEIDKLGEEGYVLSVNENNVVIAANTEAGVLYGFESLRQIISEENETVLIPQIKIFDKPVYPFRGIKLYLPGRENITFFKRFIKDFIALYKYNKIIIELNANMRLDRHPELNIAAVNFAKMLNYRHKHRPSGPNDEYQDSGHQDVADGEILEKDEVADLVNYMRSFNIEIIPELPSLTHSYYLLGGHRDLAENKQAEYPDTYCPLKPEIYKIYFDVLDEYIDVIHPKMINIGHDEWRMEKDVCELCKGKDYGELFANDVVKIHDYLAKKGIKITMWADHFLESIRKKGHRTWKSSSGYEYNIPAALRPEQVENLIPKDILIYNWHWSDINNDKQYFNFGFKQVYGNMRPEIDKWDERAKIQGILGGAPSVWAATTEMNFGKDQIYDFLGCANLLWSKHTLPMDSIAFITEKMVHNIRQNFSGEKLPSDDGCKVKTIHIDSNFNSTLNNGTDSLNVKSLVTGEIKSRNMIFDLTSNLNNKMKGIAVVTSKDELNKKEVKDIPINEDVNSIIFLHACSRSAANKKSFDIIYNFNETAELLGWYEIVYEDGFMETIPIRYGINILDWNWYQRILNNEKSDIKYNQDRYAYESDAVSCSNANENPITFFAYEWKNSRFGKKIKKINLKAVDYSKDNENSIILLAISITEKIKNHNEDSLKDL